MASSPAATPSAPMALDGSGPTVPFGKPMRALFQFAPTYRPFNHGSYGTFPEVVRAAREQRQREQEARPDTFKRFVHARLMARAREAVAPLLGPDVDASEIALVPNATTGLDTVLRSLAANWSGQLSLDEPADAVIHFSVVYPAVRNALWSLSTAGRIQIAEIPVEYPFNDDDSLVKKLHEAVRFTTSRNLTPRLAIFDTFGTLPAVRMPWERLTAACKELGLLSLIDGAHGIGLQDLTHVGSTVKPDFFVSNCHKWLFAPRGCAVLYVPKRNQHLITTSLPTSYQYLAPDAAKASPTYFVDLFETIATNDFSSFYVLPEAIAFRRDVCGGEETIRRYCVQLAAVGGDRVAARLGTKVLDNAEGTLRKDSVFANVQLPIQIGDFDESDILPSNVAAVLTWLQCRAADRYDACFQWFEYTEILWVRLSAQIYLDLDDFDWAAETLSALVEGVKRGEWRQE